MSINEEVSTNSQVEVLSVYHIFLFSALIAFVITLMLPQGVRRACLGSSRRRYSYSSWVRDAQLPTTDKQVKEIPNREQYVTLKDINTSLLSVATLTHGNELSPLECVENAHGYQSIFRYKSAKKTNPSKIPSKYKNIFDYYSPRDSVTASFASTGIFSPPSEFFNDSENEVGVAASTQKRHPLSDIKESHPNINDKTPIDISNYFIPSNMDYSPSPLSIVSRNVGGSIVVMVSGDKDTKEDIAIALLRSTDIKYYVIDAMDPLQSKRRQNLVYVSGINGHYPQVFYVNDQRRAVYIGNHEVLLKLEKQGSLRQSVLHQNAESTKWNNEIRSVLDSSYFSV